MPRPLWPRRLTRVFCFAAWSRTLAEPRTLSTATKDGTFARSVAVNQPLCVGRPFEYLIVRIGHQHGVIVRVEPDSAVQAKPLAGRDVVVRAVELDGQRTGRVVEFAGHDCSATPGTYRDLAQPALDGGELAGQQRTDRRRLLRGCRPFVFRHFRRFLAAQLAEQPFERAGDLLL